MSSGWCSARRAKKPPRPDVSEENPFGELLQDYVLECLPLAEQVADTFVELERRWRAADPAEESLGSLAGRLHTIKGNSAMMGLAPMRARGSVRFSLGIYNTEEDIDYVLKHLPGIIKRLRDISPLNPDHPDNDQYDIDAARQKHEQDMAAAVAE